MERKTIGQIQGRIKGEGWFAIPRYTTSLSTCIPNMTTIAYTVSQKSLTKNFIIQSIKRKKIGQIQGRISRRRLVRNPTIHYIIINLHTKYDYSSLHSFTEIFDENFIIQSMERKKLGQIKGRISRRGLVCNRTTQHVIINLYTKYDSSSLQGCGEIFDEKVLRITEGWTNGRTDGMTDRCKPVYPPLFQSGGIKKSALKEKNQNKILAFPWPV